MIRPSTTSREPERVRDLPNFTKPPLNEVVLSIQFAPLTNLKSAHVGLFWQHMRSSYPQVTEQPPIQSMFETFGIPSKQPAFMQIEALLAPPLPRYWFENHGQPDLLQLQQDRILHNWRQHADNSRLYPRYGAVKQTFMSEISVFEAWLTKEGLGELRPNQCEVTYINIIKPSNSESAAHNSCMQEVTSLWTGTFSESLPNELERVQVDATCLFSLDGKPAGRVYVKFQPAFLNTDKSPVVKLEITARGRPRGETVSDALDFLDIAREQVVRTFVAVTTKEMQKLWGRTDG